MALQGEDMDTTGWGESEVGQQKNRGRGETHQSQQLKLHVRGAGDAKKRHREEDWIRLTLSKRVQRLPVLEGLNVKRVSCSVRKDR